MPPAGRRRGAQVVEDFVIRSANAAGLPVVPEHDWGTNGDARGVTARKPDASRSSLE